MTATADPGAEWPAAVGLYVAIVSTTLVALVAAATGVSSDVVFGLAATAFTAGVLCGAVVARATPSLAVRLGGWRWRTPALCLPALVAAGFTGLLAAKGVLPVESDVGLAAFVAIGVGLPAHLLASVARDVYVDAAVETPDEPTAAWTWHQSGRNAPMIGLGVGCLLLAAVLTLEGGVDRFQFHLTFIGVGSLAVGRAPTLSITTPNGSAITLLSISGVDYVRGDLRAYDAGLVYEPRFSPSYRRLVPWDQVIDVRATDETLIIERRLRPAIRCDRSAVDDLEGVLKAIETSRRTDRPVTHRLTTLERERNA